MPSGGTVVTFLDLGGDFNFFIDNIQLNMVQSVVYAAKDVNKTIDDGS